MQAGDEVDPVAGLWRPYFFSSIFFTSVFFAFFAFLAFFAALVPFVLPSSFFISPPAGAAGAAGVAGVAGGADGACAKVEEMKARAISTAKIAARIVFIADSPPSRDRPGLT